MSKSKIGMWTLLLVCFMATALGVIWAGGLDRSQIQRWLTAAGIWAPVLYVFFYTVGTLLILPSTALNLSGGAIFGFSFGLLWTSIGAILAAVVAFIFARTVGREAAARRLGNRWKNMDAELHQGAFAYMFAIRLVPILPYGLVNFAAGLTSIRFQDYFWGTTLGTVPSVLPFVLIGSSGVQALQTGELLPLLGSFSLTALLVGGATWYRRRRNLGK